jgi:hypothetical protein
MDFPTGQSHRDARASMPRAEAKNDDATSDVHVHAVIGGHGPPLLLVHG